MDGAAAVAAASSWFAYFPKEPVSLYTHGTTYYDRSESRPVSAHMVSRCAVAP